ncbi:hypothetical protein WICPIJ_006816 [Wickerhamomyces pijperi]|uniref:DUF1748-domain-containing protein n=1 Tax=Wickerhamomyces pijperi TaxID=599730 RepID=A0A9P8Q2S8_WICPI|nr:hypothetical protein WICPIJ_006816 [Wickerhamomyces pijperi]
MTVFGKTIHFGIDLILLSTALAGIKRNTGLTIKSEKITDSKDFQGYIESYLNVGEKSYDMSVAWMSGSEYFVRK